MSTQTSDKYGKRLREITAVLHKHEITRGVTPEKLRMILEELGPTYIKLGQIASMHSDILPRRYCEELMRLRSEVAPMEFEQVVEVLEDSYGCPYTEIFEEIEKDPLGSASIAQVHKAVLKDGSPVVIKVQRKGIYGIMARDIALLRKAVRLLPPVREDCLQCLSREIGEARQTMPKCIFGSASHSAIASFRDFTEVCNLR